MTDKERLRAVRLESLRAWREENREHINAYHREWSKNNRDKVNRYQQRYWLKKAIDALENN